MILLGQSVRVEDRRGRRRSITSLNATFKRPLDAWNMTKAVHIVLHVTVGRNEKRNQPAPELTD